MYEPCIHACVAPSIHSHITHTHTYTHTHTRTTNTHTHTYTRTYTHTYTHTRIHTHTHAHTHTNKSQNKQAFWNRYAALSPSKASAKHKTTPKKNKNTHKNTHHTYSPRKTTLKQVRSLISGLLTHTHTLTQNEWRVGLTKVYLKKRVYDVLEGEREKVVIESVLVLQSRVRGNLARRAALKRRKVV